MDSNNCHDNNYDAEYSIRRKSSKNSTFKPVSMVTVPDELGTETNKLLHQRLQKKSRGRKINIEIEKFDSNKQKKQK
jgi:hypothetical protein